MYIPGKVSDINDLYKVLDSKWRKNFTALIDLINCIKESLDLIANNADIVATCGGADQKTNGRIFVKHKDEYLMSILDNIIIESSLAAYDHQYKHLLRKIKDTLDQFISFIPSRIENTVTHIINGTMTTGHLGRLIAYILQKLKDTALYKSLRESLLIDHSRTELLLSYVALEHSNIQQLKEFNFLTHLTISAVTIGGRSLCNTARESFESLFNILESLPNLEKLNLSSNRLGARGNGEILLINLSKLKNLTELDLSNNHIDDTFIEKLQFELLLDIKKKQIEEKVKQLIEAETNKKNRQLSELEILEIKNEAKKCGLKKINLSFNYLCFNDSTRKIINKLLDYNIEIDVSGNYGYAVHTQKDTFYFTNKNNLYIKDESEHFDSRLPSGQGLISNPYKVQSLIFPYSMVSTDSWVISVVGSDDEHLALIIERMHENGQLSLTRYHLSNRFGKPHVKIEEFDPYRFMMGMDKLRFNPNTMENKGAIKQLHRLYVEQMINGLNEPFARFFLFSPFKSYLNCTQLTYRNINSTYPYSDNPIKPFTDSPSFNSTCRYPSNFMHRLYFLESSALAQDKNVKSNGSIEDIKIHDKSLPQEKIKITHGVDKEDIEILPQQNHLNYTQICFWSHQGICSPSGSSIGHVALKVCVNGEVQYASLWPVHNNKLDAYGYVLYPQHAELHSYEKDVSDTENGEGRLPDEIITLSNVNHTDIHNAIKYYWNKCNSDGKFLSNDMPWSLLENCSSQRGHSCVSFVHMLLTRYGGLAEKMSNEECSIVDSFLKNPQSYLKYIQKVKQAEIGNNNYGTYTPRR